MTYRQVFGWLFVFAFAPELVRALRWALPVVLGLGAQPSVEAAARGLVAVAATAALLYWVLRAAAALWRRRGPERRR